MRSIHHLLALVTLDPASSRSPAAGASVTATGSPTQGAGRAGVVPEVRRSEAEAQARPSGRRTGRR